MSTPVKTTAAIWHLVKKYAEAQVELSWKGSKHPDDHVLIELDAHTTEVKLKAALGELMRHHHATLDALVALGQEIRT